MTALPAPLRPAHRAPGRQFAAACLLCALWGVGLIGLFVARQAPLGGLRGRLVAAETGRPVPGAHLFLAPANPSVPGRRRRLAVDRDGRFHLRNLHAGAYTLSASSRAHHLRAMRITVTEGEVLHLALEMTALSPFLELHTPQRVFLPGEPVRVTAHGFVRSETLAMQTFRVDPMRVMRDARGSLWRVLAPGGPERWGQPETPVPLESIPSLTLISSSRVSPPRDAEGVFTRRLTVPVREPGVYLVACQADGLERLAWVMVTDLGLIVKQTADRCLLYAVDLATGKPAVAEITLLDGADTLGAGRSARDGTLSLPLRGAGETVLACARRGESLAFIRLWTGNRNDGPQRRVFLFTDRPVYRPGQRVYFKGIARELAGATLLPPTPGPVRIEVRDPRDTLVWAGETRSSDLGAFDGTFQLSPEAATGLHTLAADVGGERHEATFSVAAYRKPEYRVDVQPERDAYTRGEAGWFRIEARYFFGAPVVGATVQYTVLRSPLWPWMEEGGGGEDRFEYGAGPGEGEVVAEGETRTGPDGRCLVRFDTAPPEASPASRDPFFEPDDHDYVYSLEATVSDQGRFTAEGSAKVKVWRGELDVALEPDCFILSPGEQVGACALVRDHAGRPRAGVPVELTLVRRRWQGDRFLLTTVARASARTGGEGRAAASLRPPGPGDYQVRALVTDQRGNQVPASAWVWVTGAADTGPLPNGASLRVVADRKEYRPGDTATFLIHSSLVGATALVTAEADDLLSYRLVPLTGPATAITLPIGRKHVPNFQLSVCCVRDKEFVHQQIDVPVSSRLRELQVAVKPDRAVYAPGDRATYRVTTRDPAGRPVPAEVSLAVVDESIYAIREDNANVRAAFYPWRYSRVATEFSFPSIYLSGGDKSGMPDSVRKEFPDTALWLPDVRTDARGEATVTFRVPDTLTTWRATARAHTRDTLVGQAVSRVVCRKPLMVRFQAPRFLTERDAAVVSTMVHNDTGAPQRVSLRLLAEGVRLEGSTERRVRLRAGEVARLDWRVLAPRAGSGRLVVTAQADGGWRDAVEQRIPVLPHGRARRECVAGTLTGTGEMQQKVVLRPDSTGVTDVGLYLAPSLASGMLSALQYLAEYPYGCTEQTLSAFLPDLVVHRALRRLGIGPDRLRRTLPEMVNTGLQRLYRFQHDDGGWGWWEYDRSDPAMTAYVLHGLLTARQEGFAVNPDSLKHGVEWLLVRERDWMARGIPRLGGSHRVVYGAPPDEPAPVLLAPVRGGAPPSIVPPERAEALWALARAGSAAAVARALEAPPGAIEGVRDVAALARLCLAARQAGRAGEADQVSARLVAQARETDAFCHWGNDPEATALALQALLAGQRGVGSTLAATRPATDRLVTKAVRWLLAQRDGDHWRSTWATARVLFALVHYLEVRREAQPAFTVAAQFNGRALQQVRFTPADLFRPEVRLEVPAAWVRPGENVLRLQKTGPGNLYYTLRLRQFTGQEDVPALFTDAGISVERTYHRLRPGPDPDTGALRLLPADRPTTRLRAGETYLGRIVIRSPRSYEHVVIEEPLPAGCEPLDRGRTGEDEWDHWWTEADVRDSQIAFFARSLPAGRRVIEYYVRAAVPGTYHVMPTGVSGMYDPAVCGGGEEMRVEVR